MPRPSPSTLPVGTLERAADALLGFDNHPAPSFVYDEASLRILAVNDAAVRLYGYGRQRFLALTMADIEIPEELGPLVRGIGHHRKADGTAIAVRVETSRVDVDRRPAILAVAIDVSELEAALSEGERRRRELAESEQRYRQLFKIGFDYYWEMDAQYRMTYLSPEYEALFGIPISQMLGKRFIDTPGISIDPEMGRKGILAQKAKQPYRDLVFSRTSGGKRLWFSTNAAPIFGEDGEFRGYRGVAADITERVETEAEAQLARRRLHDALAHVSQPFGVFDSDERLVAFNQAFTDLHTARGSNTPVHEGASCRDILAWQLSSGFHATPEGERPLDLETLTAHYRSEAEHTYRLQDGRWMLVAHRRLPGGGCVALWTDITAIKRAEEERRDLEAQLHHSQRLEALGTLAGGVAHELNNTLVPLVALTKIVAQRLPEGGRDRANLETVMTAGARARDLVKQILTFARKHEQRYVSVDLAAVVREALRLMRGVLPATIRLEDAIAPVPPMSGDPGQLHQVVVNLVTNAAQAITAAHGTVAVGVRAEPDGTRLRLSVADTGCGMDPATVTRIFEPFFTTKDVGRGTGLGLAVVHGIVSSHGGAVEVESAPGKGTRVEVIFPVEME